MSKTLKLMKNRRSIYHLGSDLPLSKGVIAELITQVSANTPSAFNSQSSRLLLLFGKEHQRLWQIVADALKAVVPEESYPETLNKIEQFAAGAGTLLLFEDQSVVAQLQRDFPLYADNFPKWSEQAHGITAFALWTALAEAGIGASLQHYNELISEKVSTTWDLPTTWQLKAQMPFGAILSPAGQKSYRPTEERIKIVG